MKRSALPLFALLLVGSPTHARAQQAARAAPAASNGTAQLTPADIRGWKSIRSPTVSPDGKWFLYQLAPGDGDATVIARSTTGNTEWKFPVGEASGGGGGGGGRGGAEGAIRVSGDSKWAVFPVPPTKREADRLRAQRRPLEMKAALVNLTTGQKKEFDRIRRFAFSGDRPTWIGLYTYGAEPAAAAAAAVPPAGRGAAAAPARVDASDLLLYNLSTGELVDIGSVGEFAFDDSGKYLAYTVDTRDRVGNGVQLLDLRTNAVRPLDSERAQYSRLTWTPAENGLALAALRAAIDSTGRDTTVSLLAFTSFEGTAPKKTVLALSGRTDAPVGLALSMDRAPQWSQDRGTIYLGLKEAPKYTVALAGEARGFNGQSLVRPGAPGMGGAVNQPNLPPPTDDDLPSLILWHSKDPRLQSQQIVEAARDKQYSYLAEYRLADDKLIRLADDSVRELTVAPRDRFVFATEGSPYQRDAAVTGRFYSDIYTVDLRTGARSKRVSKTILNVWGLSSATWTSPSPDGTHLLYWGMDANWHLLDMASGQERNLTKGLPVSFANAESDLNHVVMPPHQVVGWSNDGNSVLLSDGWDIWNVSATGAPAINVTLNGRKEQIHYQRRAWAEADERREERGIDLRKPLYFAIYGEWTKKFGLARVDAARGGVTRLLWDDAAFQFVKAKDADVLVYSRQTSVDFPDWYVADATWTSGTRLTDANPQQKQFAWSKGARLVDYVNAQGVKLQAALHLPANYEPGKRYPTVVEIYEKRSQGARGYSVPSDRNVVNTALYTSRGYAVLEPDIVYRINDPGPSAVDCVLAAVRAAIKLGIVDSAHVGLHGHSWGGYETSFIVTQTKLFAAAIAGAPVTDYIDFYSSIYWNTGYSDSPIFESSQTRMRGAPLDNWEAYLRNSPSVHSKNVTTPLVILADDKDGAVDFHQGLAWYNTLRSLGKNVMLLEYVGENHGLARPANQRDYAMRAQQFFDHYLRGVAAPDWMVNGVPHLKMEDHLKAFRSEIQNGARTTPVGPTGGDSKAESAFAAMQARGQTAMGVDQYTSTHKFDALPDGGRIELVRDVDDSAGVAQIRLHLEEIAKAFTAGDFATPGFVHMQDVPGTRVMTEKAAAITYRYREVPRGGEVRITTTDSVAVRAIHEFLAFQRQDHHAGGIDHDMPSASPKKP